MIRLIFLLAVACCIGRALAVSGPGTGVKLPIFPDNIIAFPNRDFIHLDGFFDIAKDNDPTLRVEIWQGPSFDEIVGAAVGRVSGEATGAFEINHPGALCWGAGLPADDPLKAVTPSIEIGDKVVVKHGGDIVASMIIADARGTVQHDADTNSDDVSVVWSVANAVLTLTGSVDAGVDLTGAEVRVVAPDLRDRFPGLRRDVRVTTAGPSKLPGLIQAGSLLSFGPVADGRRSWKATFEFDGDAELAASNARTAHDGGIPSITFAALTDGSGNAQGVTITEFLEAGGSAVPGVCPAGPKSTPLKAGTYSTQPTPDAGKVNVLWTLPAAGTAQQAVRTGFLVSARSRTPGSGKKYAEVGQYIADPTTTSTVLTLPDASPDAADWEFRVRAEVTGQQLSAPFPLAAAQPSTTTGTSDPSTCSNPIVKESVANGKVILTVTPNVPIYYTTDNTPALENTAFLAAKVLTYEPAKGIAIPAGGFWLSWVAFDAGTGSCTDSAEPHLIDQPATPQVKTPPVISPLSAGQQLKILTAWTSTDAAAADFIVKVWKSETTPAVDPDTGLPPPTVVAALSDTTTAKSLTFPDLTPGDSYWFKVAGRNADRDVGPWSDFNAAALIVQNTADTIVVTQNRYKAAQDWRVAGTSTAAPGDASLSICKVNFCGEPGAVNVVGGIGLVAPAAAGGLSTWGARFTKGNAGNDPVGFKTYISSSAGGKIISIAAA